MSDQEFIDTLAAVKAEAASAMLAALQWATTFAQGSYDSGDPDLQNDAFRQRLAACQAAIAQAEAAGIK